MMEPGCTSVSLVRYSIFTLPLFANWMSLVTTPLSLHDLSVAPICVFSDKIDRTRLDAAQTSSTTPTTPVSVMTASPTDTPARLPQLMVKSPEHVVRVAPYDASRG